MKSILIEWLEDDVDCETCGTTFADGAKVYIDDKEAFILEPHAHCYNGQSFTHEDVFIKILEYLNYQVIQKN